MFVLTLLRGTLYVAVDVWLASEQALKQIFILNNCLCHDWDHEQRGRRCMFTENPAFPSSENNTLGVAAIWVSVSVVSPRPDSFSTSRHHPHHYFYTSNVSRCYRHAREDRSISQLPKSLHIKHKFDYFLVWCGSKTPHSFLTYSSHHCTPPVETHQAG